MRSDLLIKRFGDLVRKARESHHQSQEELGFNVGMHRNYIGMIERGERNISFDKALLLIRYLEIDIKELYDEIPLCEQKKK